MRDTLTRTLEWAKLGAQLDLAGLSWEELCESAMEVILFGSRAAGCATEDSDWDLLAVGRGRSILSDGLDLLWVKPEILETEAWLTSELASHLQHYGLWLHGKPGWLKDVRISEQTIEKKSLLVGARLSVFLERWSRLSERSRETLWTRLRLDLQRLALLRKGEAVPPRQMLDMAWEAVRDFSQFSQGVGDERRTMLRDLQARLSEGDRL